MQAAAVLTLVPLLQALFGDNPAGGWPWVALMVALLAGGWSCDIAATRAGLRVGFGLVDAGVHQKQARDAYFSAINPLDGHHKHTIAAR